MTTTATTSATTTAAAATTAITTTTEHERNVLMCVPHVHTAQFSILHERNALSSISLLYSTKLQT